MTAPEMNVRVMKKMSRPIVIAVALTGGGLLTSCASAFGPGVDSSSPVAPRVQALVDANRTYPRWRDFPKAEAAPAPVEFAARVNRLQASGSALSRDVERLEWTLADPTTLARDVAARIDATQASPESIKTSAEIDAEAAALRARAVAPPPIDRPH